MKHPDRMRYQKNKLSYLLCLFALLLDIVSLAATLGYPPVIVPNPLSGGDVIVHILFLMTCFLTAEKMKVYSAAWAYIGIGLGVIQFLKIFIFIMPYYKQGMMNAGILAGIICLLLTIAACLVSAAAVCIVRARKLKNLPATEIV